MSENSNLFDLNQILRSNNYSELAIAKTNHLLESILSKNYAIISGEIINASGVRPKIKVNPKSIRIRLRTDDLRDMIIINHPENTWGDKDILIIGNHKFFQTPINQKIGDEFKKLEKYNIYY